MRVFSIVTMLLAALVIARSGVAQSTPPQARAQATLVSDTSTIVPGHPFTVAIVFKLEPSWHVYFKEPGDSGLPPSVKWTLPEGITAGELQFPKPEVLKGLAGTNFVYHDEVALLVEMTPSKEFRGTSGVEIGAALKWLECDADTCVPQKQLTSLTINAGNTATPTHTERFKAWREKVKEGESFDPATAK